jgi:membrane-associated PAP2 superfamily phosphatase
VNEPDYDEPGGKTGSCRPGNLALYGFLLIAAFFLLSEHRAHVFGILPYLLLLACPLIHLFMHRGHGKESRHSTDGEEKR